MLRAIKYTYFIALLNVNGPLCNIPEFYETFDITKDMPMYLDEQEWTMILLFHSVILVNCIIRHFPIYNPAKIPFPATCANGNIIRCIGALSADKAGIFPIGKAGGF